MVSASPSIFGLWALYTAAGLAAIALALLILWLRGDRARGRLRCGKCWYDMKGAPSLTCPECGRIHKTERALRKTRRRWWQATLSALLLTSSLGLCSAWFFTDLTRLKVLPTWALVDLIRARNIVGWKVANNAIDALTAGDPKRSFVTDRGVASIVDAWIDSLPPSHPYQLRFDIFDRVTTVADDELLYGRIVCIPPDFEREPPAERSAARRLGRVAPWLIPRLVRVASSTDAQYPYIARRQSAEFLGDMSWTSDAAARALVELISKPGPTRFDLALCRDNGGVHLLPLIAPKLESVTGPEESDMWWLIGAWTATLAEDEAARAAYYTPQVRAALARAGVRQTASWTGIELLKTLPPPPAEVPALVHDLVRHGLGPAPGSAFTSVDGRVRDIIEAAGDDAIGDVGALLTDPDKYTRHRACEMFKYWASQRLPRRVETARLIWPGLVADIGDAESTVSWSAQQAALAQLARPDAPELLKDAELRRSISTAVLTAIDHFSAGPNRGSTLLTLADIAGKLGPDSAPIRAKLTELAESDDKSIRGLARQALSRLD